MIINLQHIQKCCEAYSVTSVAGALAVDPLGDACSTWTCAVFCWVLWMFLRIFFVNW